MQISLDKFPSTRKFILGKDCGYFPVVATTNGKDIIVIYRAGAGHMGIKGRLESIRSENRRNWSEPVIIANSEGDDRNPAVGVTKDGVVVVAYHVNKNYRGEKENVPELNNLKTYIIRSKDAGMTWERPYKLNLKQFQGLSPYGQMLTLSDGSILMPIYGVKDFKTIKEKIPSCSYLIRSTDNGLTWEEYSKVDENVDETAFLALPEGKILGVMRSAKDGHLSLTFTKNPRKGWSVPVNITAPFEHPACLTLLSNGYILLSYGFRAKPYGARGLISKDNGQTWVKGKEIIFEDKVANWDCGYPSTILVKTGWLATAYYSTTGKEADPWSCQGAECHLLIYREEKLLQFFRK